MTYEIRWRKTEAPSVVARHASPGDVEVAGPALAVSLLSLVKCPTSRLATSLGVSQGSWFVPCYLNDLVTEYAQRLGTDSRLGGRVAVLPHEDGELLKGVLRDLKGVDARWHRAKAKGVTVGPLVPISVREKTWAELKSVEREIEGKAAALRKRLVKSGGRE